MLESIGLAVLELVADIRDGQQDARDAKRLRLDRNVGLPRVQDKSCESTRHQSSGDDATDCAVGPHPLPDQVRTPF